MYRKNARKDYLNLAKSKKHSAKRYEKQLSNSCSIYEETEAILRLYLAKAVN